MLHELCLTSLITLKIKKVARIIYFFVTSKLNSGLLLNNNLLI